MKRITLLLFVLLTLGVSGAWADDWTPSFPEGSIIKVGSKVSSITAATSAGDNAHWYFITQLRGGESAIYDTGTQIFRGGTNKTPASFNGTSPSTNAAYLVRFISTGSTDIYNIQFGTGRYAKNYDSTPGNVAVETSTTAGNYAFYNCNGGTGSYFGWNLGTDDGKSVNNNSAGYSVAFWNTGKRSGTSTADNAIWYVYSVEIGTPVDITYSVILNGSEFTSATESQPVGGTLSLPSSAKRDFCDYEFYSTSALTGETLTTVPVEATTVYAKPIWNGPFTISSDFANASWYLLRMKDGSKNMKYQDGTSAYPLEDVASYDIDAESYYSWAFTGDAYNGFTILNKQAGSTKKLYKGASVGNGGIPTMSADNASTWIITRGTSDSNFGISPKGHSYYLNAWSGGATVQYWQTGPGGDSGSRFTIQSVDDIDFTSMVTSYINPYIENPSNAYFAVTTANVSTLLDDHADGGDKTSWTKSEYQAYYNALQNAITKPTAGYYVLKNVNSGKYLTYNATATANGENNTAAAIIKLGVSGSGYTLQMQGGYLKVPNYTESLSIRASSAVFYATMANNTPGQIKLGTDDGAHSYLNYTGGVVQGLQPTSDTGWWVLEDAPSSISIPLHAANDNTNTAHTYATLCVPFNITGLTGVDDKDVKAYIPTKSGDYIVPDDEDTKVTEGVPVLLIGEDGATSVTATIGSNYATAPVTTDVVLTGTFTGTTIDCTAATGTNYVLGLDEDNDDRIGFYHVSDGSSFALGANRAYLKLDASGDPTHVKGFAIDFSGSTDGVNGVKVAESNGKVFDLSGREVAKPVRGIYIKDGRKVVVK